MKNLNVMETKKRILVEIEDIPELPQIALKIMEKIDDSNIDNKELARFIEASPALTLKILKIVNSPFFGFSQKITNLYQAIGLLGRKKVKNIAFTIFVLKKLVDKFHDEYLIWESLIYSLIVTRYLSKNEKLKYDIIILNILLNVPKMIIIYLKLDSLKYTKDFYFSEENVELVDTYLNTLEKKWNIDKSIIDVLKDYHLFCLGEKINNRLVHILYCANKIANFLALNGENFDEILKDISKFMPISHIDNDFIEDVKNEADEIIKIFNFPFNSKYFTDILLFLSKANNRIFEKMIANEKLIENIKNLNILLSTAFNNLPLGVIIFENEKVSLINLPALEILDLNSKILDFTFDEFINNFLDKSLFKKDLESIKLNTVLSNGHPVELSYIGYKHLLSRKIIFLKSIKEEQVLREKYSDLRETYINILNCTAHGIVITDLKLKITFVNDRFLNMIKDFYGKEEKPIGEDFIEIFKIDKNEILNFKKNIVDLLKKDINEKRIELKNKLNEIYELTITKFIHSGSLSGFQFLIKKITEEKRLKEELLKNEVTAQVAGATAHDLNQPLTTLTLTLDILKEKINNKEYQKYIEKMENSVNRISEIVKKLSKITKYETRSYFGNDKIISFGDD